MRANLVLGVLCVFLLLTARVEAWTFSTVDTSASGVFCMALDKNNGERHIIFEDSDADPAALYVLDDNGAGMWSARSEVEVIVNDSYAGDPACALDSLGNLHSAYSFQHVIYHETDMTAPWTDAASAIDSTGRNEISHMVVDSGGNNHVIYFDETNDDLLYSTDAGGSWSTPELVDADATHTMVTYASMAIDVNDRLHVAYYESGGKNLMYGTLDTTSATDTWSTTVIHDQVEPVGQSNSIAVSGDGDVHIAFMGDLAGLT